MRIAVFRIPDSSICPVRAVEVFLFVLPDLGGFITCALGRFRIVSFSVHSSVPGVSCGGGL